MRFSTLACMTAFATVVSAHFQLQFPTPRGVFVEDEEPSYCDGYVSAVSNRTTFPLSSGFVSINSEHPQWTLGGIIATVQNPENFPAFEDSAGNFQQFLPYFETTGEGLFCVDVDLASTGISGIEDGANVTLQLIFSGGDGELFQCADLTLSSNYTIPSSVECTNATKNAVATPVSVSLNPTSTSPSSSSSSSTSTSSATSNAAVQNIAMGASGMAGLFGAVLALL